MYKTIFTIEGVAPAYIGYTSGRLWNGWATPFFELSEALALMTEHNKYRDNPMHYDEGIDAFCIAETEYTDEAIWEGIDYQTAEGIKHLYGIGAYCWMWDAVEDRSIAQQTEEFIYYHDTYNYWDEYDNRREETVNTIAEQLKNIDTFYNIVCIMRDEELSAEARFEKLGGVLKL